MESPFTEGLDVLIITGVLFHIAHVPYHILTIHFFKVVLKDKNR